MWLSLTQEKPVVSDLLKIWVFLGEIIIFPPKSNCHIASLWKSHVLSHSLFEKHALQVHILQARLKLWALDTFFCLSSWHSRLRRSTSCLWDSCISLRIKVPTIPPALKSFRSWFGCYLFSETLTFVFIKIITGYLTNGQTFIVDGA